MMHISLLVDSVTHSYSFDGERALSSLELKCHLHPKSGILEVGDRYAFAVKNSRVVRGRVSFDQISLSIRRRSILSEETVSRLRLGNDKIGELYFVPPDNEKRLLKRDAPGLDAAVFLPDSDLYRLSHSTEQAKRSINLSLELSEHPSLAYGWEPDGSRAVWTLNESEESEPLPIARFTIQLSLYAV